MHDPPYRDPRLSTVDRLLEGPEPDEAGWYDGVRRYLEDAYLAGENPRAQSGFGGDAAYWERARRPMTGAIERDGTVLDVGCANGLLMEDIAAWAAEDGYRIEPYGLDFSSAIADLARRRLPYWKDRIYTGNVI
ncbi:MAG: class I SAM-dependent methyltransferase, partial [Chloroflexota bacterium]|nr:class I SAM-dependent methyltransferase [Chloroflexota bacterium]